MWLALLLQGSLFVSPLHLESDPPESRAARALVVDWDRSVPADPAATRDAAKALAQELVVRLRAGAEFEELTGRARAFSRGSGGGALGSFFPGVLAPAVDEFLFSADEFACSDPIESERGFHIVQRLDRLAGCRAILLAGDDAQARARELRAKLVAGGDFGALAREFSNDGASAARGGDFAIFERGPSDSLLKAAVFALRPNEIGGPLETPVGQYLFQRVDPAAIDPALADVSVVRLRMILVAFSGARGSTPELSRDHAGAETLAQELVIRIRKGEDMAMLAARYDDDGGGRARRGDVGWIRRRSPQIQPVLDRAFSLPVGNVQDPIATNAGWLILRRER